MDFNEAKKRIEKLKQVIEHHRYLYHVKDTQEISDAALDSLKHELKKLEDEFPKLRSKDSPAQRVSGEVLKKFKKVKHAVPMLSLEDIFNAGELEEWTLRIEKLIGKTHIPELFVESKFDGLALSLLYRDGILERASTRGNGKEGEDVTQNARTIETIPLELLYHGKTGTYLERMYVRAKKGLFELRGEVIISKKNFEHINALQKKRGDTVYANPRNLAAGSVRQLDSAITAERRLDFFAYSIATDVGQRTHSDEHALFAAMGFKSDDKAHIAKSLKGVQEYRDVLELGREKLAYHIDGLVVSVNDNTMFKKLGVVGKAPRGSIAYKFSPAEATTIVKDIIVQVGRTGAITPVAVLEPVEIAGVTVSRATLHNEDEIERLGVRVGDTVIVGRAGDVIPDIREVITKLRTGKEKAFRVPAHCPVCKRAIKKVGAIHRCVNAKCPARHREHLYHFASKVAFDIDGLGPKIVDALLDNGLIQDAGDLFELEEGDVAVLDRFGEKSAENLIGAIKEKRSIHFSRFLMGLGILHVGEETALNLADYFGTLERLERASLEEINSIPNIGDVVAKSIYGWFRDPINMRVLKNLRSHVTITHLAKKKGAKLKGKTFVLTGTLETMIRDEAKDRIRALGGDVSSSVSKETDYVVAGAEPGSKKDKAGKLGVEVLTEKEFLKLIRE